MSGWIEMKTTSGRRLLIRKSEVAFAAEVPAWAAIPAKISIVLRSGERGEAAGVWDDFATALTAVEQGSSSSAEDEGVGRTCGDARGTMGSDQ